MKILVIAPHADDEILGVGGTIAKHTQSGHDVTVAVVTGHGEKQHPLWPASTWETIRQECIKACAHLGVSHVEFRELPAALLDVTPSYQVNGIINDLIKVVGPEEVYIPFSGDLHKDHAAVSYAVMVAARSYLYPGSLIKRLYAYETLSETHLAAPYIEPGFSPNVFVDITEQLDVKLAAMDEYKSQLSGDKQPRSLRCMKALAEFRGAHAGVGAAEAFYLIRELK